MNSADVNRFLSCFAESREDVGHTLKAFIFSLKNSEGLPPFKCLAKDKRNAIYDSSVYGPTFGKGSSFTTGENLAWATAKAWIGAPYSVPKEVTDKKGVLAGNTGNFYPDNYEVFSLA